MMRNELYNCLITSCLELIERVYFYQTIQKLKTFFKRGPLSIKRVLKRFTVKTGRKVHRLMANLVTIWG